MLRLNLGCGNRLRNPANGWLNCDKRAGVGIDRVVDLFKVPWPFEDNSVDEVYMSHLVEHIPHEIKEAKPGDYPDYLRTLSWEGRTHVAIQWQARWDELKNLDGFLAFFAEVWRICKHEAKVVVKVPYGFSNQGLQDPTHTRYMVGPSFAYLTDETNNLYYVPLRFKTVACEAQIRAEDLRGRSSKSAQFMADRMTNVIGELKVVLVVVKDGKGPGGLPDDFFKVMQMKPIEYEPDD